MADLTVRIPTITSGDSAYDFRQRLNEAINSINIALDEIEEIYDKMLDIDTKYQGIHSQIEAAKGEIASYVNNDVKSYIDDYVAQKLP